MITSSYAALFAQHRSVDVIDRALHHCVAWHGKVERNTWSGDDMVDLVKQNRVIVGGKCVAWRCEVIEAVANIRCASEMYILK